MLKIGNLDNYKKGIVLYTDGGSKENSQFAGWGIHGYVYDCDIVKKIPGNIGHILTKAGYVLKLGASTDLSITEVIPVEYIDGYGSLLQASNNVAELTAAINALRHANKYDIAEIQLFTDSEYVRKGLESWVSAWIRNNWQKHDGGEPANRKQWEELLEAKNILTQRGVKVKINWVKGHSDILGNVLADKLATVAVTAAKRKRLFTEITTTPPIGYWKTDSGEHHPLIANNRMFFNTMPEFIKSGEYYLGDTDKGDDTFGSRTSDGAYAVVMLDNADDVLELIRNYQSKIAYGSDSIIMAKLDTTYRSGIYQDLLKYGELAIDRISPARLDIFALAKNNDGFNYREPLTYEFNPPKLCMRAVEHISRLANLLNQYLEKHPDLIVTDITDILFSDESKTNKKGIVTVSKKLKPIYDVGYAALKIDVNYKVNDSINTIPIIVTLGIDLVNRNALKRLESLDPKILVITWMDAPDMMRYATIVEVNDGKAIYCGVYSNRRIIPS